MEVKILLSNEPHKVNIIEWFKKIRTDSKCKHRVSVICNSGLDNTLFKKDLDQIDFEGGIVFIDWLLFAKNFLDIKELMYSNHSTKYICLLPYVKPFDESKSKHYPIDIQDAINHNFVVCYLDEKPPLKHDSIMVVSVDEYIITNEQIISILS